MEPEDMADNARKASNLLKAMGNETRLMILCQLLHGERTVTDLMGCIGLSQSALSQHLAVLRQHDLVQTRRCARSIYYSLAGPESRSVIETLYELYGPASRTDADGRPVQCDAIPAPKGH